MIAGWSWGGTFEAALVVGTLQSVALEGGGSDGWGLGERSFAKTLQSVAWGDGGGSGVSVGGKLGGFGGVD
jgi:hypothetical protein